MIRCENLTKIYMQGDQSIYAVNNCSIHIKKGEFTAITGMSGSGKSTLLQLLAAYNTPTSGKIFIDGQNICNMGDKKLSKFRNTNIGFVFQNFHLFPILTAKENILMPALIRGENVPKTYFDEIAETLNISDRLDHLPSELSGGQQQRVAVARALINRPSILLADEPTGNLDKASGEELIEMLIKMKESYNRALVVVTHDMTIAQRADTIYNIDNGIVRLL